MTENGYGVQVVEVSEDHSYHLNEEALATVLLQEGLKDLPVVVVSLAGAARGGKSFLLNFFLRYLIAPNSSRQDGSWMGNSKDPLTGFSWRGGSERNTTGIQLWSEPLVVTKSDGTKTVVLLMDTQGTFDNKSTVRDCSTIFALSTLMSSVQIYNLPGGLGIQEDDLQHLELFTQYGRLVGQSQEGQKAFQVLNFLVRDWPNADEYAYGFDGGQLYLDNAIMKVPRDMPAELSDLRQHLRESFETLECFLMPHPGLIVRKKTFEGKVSDMEEEFIDCLRQLMSSIFNPDHISTKVIDGRAIKCGDLYTYFTTYMTIFNSKDIPTPKSILEATTEAGLLLASKSALEKYSSAMEGVCGEGSPALSSAELGRVHQQERAAALQTFTDTKKLGSPEQVQEHLDKLTSDIDARLSQYKSNNTAKVTKALKEAEEAYDKKILEVRGTKELCLHPQDVEKVHKEAMDAATKVLDTKRKRNTGADPERDEFLSDFDKLQKDDLTHLNDQHNKLLVFSLQNEYLETMQKVFAIEPPLSSGVQESKHRAALENALEKFKQQRSRPDTYVFDVYKTNLTNKITSFHSTLSLSNNKKMDEVRKELEKLAREQANEIARLKSETQRLEKERNDIQYKYDHRNDCNIL